jgi:hypothetical protein
MATTPDGDRRQDMWALRVALHRAGAPAPRPAGIGRFLSFASDRNRSMEMKPSILSSSGRRSAAMPS